MALERQIQSLVLTFHILFKKIKRDKYEKQFAIEAGIKPASSYSP